jgi:hypothetical protein
MTRPANCPAWCTAEHPIDPFHRNTVARVKAGRAKSDRDREMLPSIAASAILFSSMPGQPLVSVHALVSGAGSACVQPREAAGLAAVIDRLATATPAQHRQLAAAIRQAAELITEGNVTR